MIADAYSKEYRENEDLRRMMSAVGELWAEIMKAGGDYRPFSVDNLEKMSAMKLIDTLSRNNIKIQYSPKKDPSLVQR